MDMQAEKKELYQLIELCVKESLGELGDQIHELSLFCTNEEESIVKQVAA